MKIRLPPLRVRARLRYARYAPSYASQRAISCCCHARRHTPLFRRRRLDMPRYAYDMPLPRRSDAAYAAGAMLNDSLRHERC